jgi:hypothetical protein
MSFDDLSLHTGFFKDAFAGPCSAHDAKFRCVCPLGAHDTDLVMFLAFHCNFSFFDIFIYVKRKATKPMRKT